MRCGCRVLPCPVEILTHPQNCNPRKPPSRPAAALTSGPTKPAAHSRGCPLTLQCTMACPGLTTCTLAGLSALWLPSAASSLGNLHKPAKPQPPQSTCPALPQHPVQAPPRLADTAEAAVDFAVLHGMLRASHSHSSRAQCPVVAECCLLLWKSPQTGDTPPPTNHLHSPAAGPSAGPTKPAAHSRGCI